MHHRQFGGMQNSDDLTDDALITRIHAGDDTAFDTLVRRFYPELLTYATRMLHSQSAADDVLQDVFFRLWRTRIALSNGVTLRAYLYTAARHSALNYLRGSRRATTLADAIADASVSGRDGTDSGDVMAQLTERELERAVVHAIAGLPERCRDVWMLVREQGLSYAEAATVLGVSVHAVNKQMTRALSLLRTALGPFLIVLVGVRL
jgi:RNA polymerase sigma-70 factor (ECF subfamily)